MDPFGEFYASDAVASNACHAASFVQIFEVLLPPRSIFALTMRDTQRTTQALEQLSTDALLGETANQLEGSRASCDSCYFTRFRHPSVSVALDCDLHCHGLYYLPAAA